MITLDQLLIILTLTSLSLYIIYWLYFKTKPYVLLIHETLIILLIFFLYIYILIYFIDLLR
jgi:hypothetical protein